MLSLLFNLKLSHYDNRFQFYLGNALTGAPVHIHKYIYTYIRILPLCVDSLSRSLQLIP